MVDEIVEEKMFGETGINENYNPEQIIENENNLAKEVLKEVEQIGSELDTDNIICLVFNDNKDKQDFIKKYKLSLEDNSVIGIDIFMPKIKQGEKNAKESNEEIKI